MLKKLLLAAVVIVALFVSTIAVLAFAMPTELKVERDAKMEGRRMTLVLQPDHKQPGAVRPNQGGTAPAASRPGGPSGAGSGLNIPQRTAAPASAPTPARPAPAPAPVAR